MGEVMTSKFTAKDVAELRKRTGAGMMDCKKALQDAAGNMEDAVDLLRKKGAAKADKRAGRETKHGVIGNYIHFTGSPGVLVEVNCETDFVARTDDFQQLAKDIAMHVASANPIAVSADELPEELLARERKVAEAQVAESGKPEAVQKKIVEGKLAKFAKEHALLDQPFVRDDKKTIGALVKEVSAKVGENIVVRRFVRYQLGDD